MSDDLNLDEVILELRQLKEMAGELRSIALHVETIEDRVSDLAGVVSQGLDDVARAIRGQEPVEY